MRRDVTPRLTDRQTDRLTSAGQPSSAFSERGDRVRVARVTPFCGPHAPLFLAGPIVGNFTPGGDAGTTLADGVSDMSCLMGGVMGGGGARICRFLIIYWCRNSSLFSSILLPFYTLHTDTATAMSSGIGRAVPVFPLLLIS